MGAPRRVALAGIGGDPVLERALLDDFEGAFLAYERISARGLEGELARPTEFFPLGPAAAGGAPCGALVVAACGALEDAGDGVRRLAGAAGGAPVYLMAAVPGRAAGEPAPPAGALAGAVVIEHGELLGRLMATPRLGAWRRPVSEAVDALVAAARMGAGLAGSPLVCRPSPLWLRIQRLMGR